MEKRSTSSQSGPVKPLAVITGASSGIGYELARQFAEHGYDLIIAAENGNIEEAGKFLRGLGAKVQEVQADLRQYEEVERLYAVVQAAGPVDALVLNAGIGLGGPFIDNELEREFDIINLNIKSVVHLAKRIIGDMAVRNKGKVLLTASIVSEMPAPFQAVYSSSKAFVLNFAESIRSELKDTNITITALMPGATETNFFERAHLQDTKIAQTKKDDPAAVARDGFEALMHGDDKKIAHSIKSKAQGVMGKLLPDRMNAGMQRGMNEPGSANR
jgi:short-subunit dehydrogenase